MKIGNYPEARCSHEHLHVCFQNPKETGGKIINSDFILYIN